MSLKNRIYTLYQVKKKRISYKQSFGWYAILSVDHACSCPIHPENVHNQQLKVFIGWAFPLFNKNSKFTKQERIVHFVMFKKENDYSQISITQEKGRDIFD